MAYCLFLRMVKMAQNGHNYQCYGYHPTRAVLIVQALNRREETLTRIHLKIPANNSINLTLHISLTCHPSLHCHSTHLSLTCHPSLHLLLLPNHPHTCPLQWGTGESLVWAGSQLPVHATPGRPQDTSATGCEAGGRPHFRSVDTCF